MKRYGQLDDAEPRTKVTPGHRNGTDRLRTQLVRKPSKIALPQLPQIGRITDRVEQLCFHIHDLAPVLTKAPAVVPEYSNSAIGSD
jgi:hypothetical protein